MTDPREELAGRLFGAGLQAAELLTVYLGDTLGLYRTLADDGPATSAELAARAGVAERYAREWLESQAASGFITVDDVSSDPSARRYTISDAHAEVLADPESPYSLSPMAKAVVAIGGALPKVAQAFRTGGGVSWAEFGTEGIEAQGDFNRPWLRSVLGSAYLPSVPDIHARLGAPGARVADFACGVGWAGIGVATAYPEVTVDGFDVDEYSIELARKHVADAGLTERVSHQVADVADLDAGPAYDLALVIEAVHDLARPVEFLAAIRRTLKPGGALIIADEKVGETFTAPADELDRFYYAASVICCLPAGMAEQPSAATGTVMRPATLRRYAEDAGFGRVTVLDSFEHDALRFYRLDP